MRCLCLLMFVSFPMLALAQREFGFDNTKSSGQPYLTPAETVARMKVAEEFEVKLFAGEPDIINPIAFTIDERGRVWAVECFEYPKRTPKGQMPRDRIVILEDTNGDGVCDKRTVFAEGKDFPHSFDLASGIEVGHGGVFLGAPPYLWFIENKDDKPGKFEVLLKGFGSQDTHETLNTFQWGPDGWLYGLHGVFTHSEVSPGQADGPTTRMNAAVWRYHPTTRKFEVFAEGTSNPWGIDWRNTDGEFILCCCVIPHLYHIVPGGIYRRQAGQSFNPHTYGEIKEICDHTFHRESGWAHAGLISLDVPHIPEKYRHSVIFGSIHGCSIKQNILKRNGSTFNASRGDDFLVSGDKNFRPINLRWGPNGDIYLIDWHDQNPCHQTKPDDWDYERGRVYRIQLKGTQSKKVDDLREKLKSNLSSMINSSDPFVYRTTLRLLHELAAVNQDESGVTTPEEYKKLVDMASKQFDLKLFWLLSILQSEPGGSTQIKTTDLKDLFPTGDPTIPEVTRIQFVRGIAGATNLKIEHFQTLARLAQETDSVAIRRELASMVPKLKYDHGPELILHALMSRKEDLRDPLIPLLVWFAYEPMIVSQTTQELNWIREHAGDNPFVQQAIIPRVMRRLVATGKPELLAAAVAFIRDVTDQNSRHAALEGLAEATKGQLFDAPREWSELRSKLSNDPDANVNRLVKQLAVSFRDPAAVRRALKLAADPNASIPDRVEAVRAVGSLRPVEGSGLLVKLLQEPFVDLQIAAIRSLGAYEHKQLSTELLRRWNGFPPAVRAEAANVLASRRDWAKNLLDSVAEKKVARQDLTDNTILRIRSFNDRGLNEQIEQVWGKFRATPKELEAVIAKMRQHLGDGPASFERGQKVFEQQCAKCHQFEGRGAQVGPPLDGAARDIEYLLANILDPNRVIGQPYFVHVVERLNGTIEIGLLHAEDEQTLTLKAEQGVLKVIPKKEIESHAIQEKSMMPEGLAAGMTEQDFRDLIRYVMAHPFINFVTMDGRNVIAGASGRIALRPSAVETKSKLIAEVTAPAPMRSRLQLGGMAKLSVTLNGTRIHDGQPGEDRPDVIGIDVELQVGVNRFEFEARYKGTQAAIYARLLDPDRKLRYPEPK